MDAVLSAFGEVEVLHNLPTGIVTVECDAPCIVKRFTWNSFRTTHCGCGRLPCLQHGQVQVLEDLFSRLAAKSQEGIPTATPRPHRCTTYDTFPTYIWDVEIAPDHTVWIANSMGAARYDPTQDGWMTYTDEQGLPGNKVHTVTVARDGSVWLTFWDEVGVSHYDGEGWRTYTVVDGLPSNKVFDVAVDVDGTIWFATGDGVSRWDPATNTWESYGEEGTLAGYLVSRIGIAGDGSMWFSGAENTTHLTLDGQTGKPIWVRYDEDAAQAIVMSSLDFLRMALAPDGKAWVRSVLGDIVFLDPQTGRWSRSSCCGWLAGTFALADNGDLWVGDSYAGVHLMSQAADSEAELTVLLHLDVDDGLASNDVHSIAVESEGVI